MKLSQKCTKAGAICNFLSVHMLEERLYALKITIVCFEIFYLPPSAEHRPMELHILLIFSQNSQVLDFQTNILPTVMKLKVSSFAFLSFT